MLLRARLRFEGGCADIAEMDMSTNGHLCGLWNVGTCWSLEDDEGACVCGSVLFMSHEFLRCGVKRTMPMTV